MPFETEEAREAYRRGVRDTLESAFSHLRPSQLRLLQQWLIDLENWKKGNPPPVPECWDKIAAY